MNAHRQRQFQHLQTPKAAAVAGILFGLLFTAGLVLLRTSIPNEVYAGTAWVQQGAGRIKVALSLIPLAGIAFLWFVGVLRDRFGIYEDRFFSTVFFGSSLLFLAMVFVSSAIAGGIIASSLGDSGEVVYSEIIYFGRAFMLQVSNVYALRMAGVFMISLGTIWLRTGLMPRWLAGITYLLALTLLIISNLSLWVTLVFPAWVFAISMYILLADQRA